MLLKLEEDAEVAYNDYDKAVKAEDRAQSYVNKVSLREKINTESKTILFSEEPSKMGPLLKMRWTKS